MDFTKIDPNGLLEHIQTHETEFLQARSIQLIFQIPIKSKITNVSKLDTQINEMLDLSGIAKWNADTNGISLTGIHITKMMVKTGVILPAIKNFKDNGHREMYSYPTTELRIEFHYNYKPYELVNTIKSLLGWDWENILKIPIDMKFSVNFYS